MTIPPLEAWSDEGILRALARLAGDLPIVDADEARRRGLGRLTEEQRRVVEGAIERLAGEVVGLERALSPFSAQTAAALQRLEVEEGCNWEITLSSTDAARAARGGYEPSSVRDLAWTCILRWPDRMVRAEGPSAEEGMQHALRAAGVAG